MPTWRAVLAAAVPGIVIFADFTLWMGFSPVFAAAVGLVVGLVALGVTRLLYDDADGELAAWAQAERESRLAAQDHLAAPAAGILSGPLAGATDVPEVPEPLSGTAEARPDAPVAARR
jgi:hypothetical protein